jgi:drug/metabolite transporter (DMT)-like permease
MNALRFWELFDTMRENMTVLDWALIILLSVLWGGSYFFAKVLVQEVPPLTVVLGRFLLGGMVLFAYIMWQGAVIPKTFEAWASFFCMGLLNSLIPAVLVTWGQTEISSGLASILVATTPIFSILLAYQLSDDSTFPKFMLAGASVCLIGVAILVGMEFPSYSWRAVVALIACVGAAFSYGLANVFGQRFRRLGIPPAVGAFGQIAATTAMVLPFALVVEQPWHLPNPSTSAWLAMFGLSCLSTAAGYMLFFRILDSAGGTNVSLVTFLVPASAIFLSWSVLGDHPTQNQAVGMVFILIGLFMIDGRFWPLSRAAR